MAHAAAKTACLAMAKAGCGGRRATGLLSRYRPSSIQRPGSRPKATPTEPDTRPAPYDAPSVFVTQSPGLWTLRPADGGLLERPGRALLCALRYPRHVPGACLGRSLGAPTIEQTVWEHLQTLLADPEVLRHQYEQGHGDPAVDVRAEHERARLERKPPPWSGRKQGYSTPIKPRSLN